MIELKNISKKFGSRQLFSDTNLHFEGGKIYALIGTSGCGKTTLLNMIGRLEPYDKGQIIYDGTSLKDIKPSVFFRDYLGYLFQDFGLIESQTVKENLNLGLVGKKLKEKEKISLMKQALNRVNLSYLDLKQPIFELSGGEAQRVALAKIILKDPPLILADEPTASLDPKNSEELLSILGIFKKSESNYYYCDPQSSYLGTSGPSYSSYRFIT
ncbi:ABC transporter ATP-binding protein [Streptococcus pneumoniae]|nr:ABC transporter ATP-binding protein [Streptococcus pneumoniae]